MPKRLKGIEQGALPYALDEWNYMHSGRNRPDAIREQKEALEDMGKPRRL